MENTKRKMLIVNVYLELSSTNPIRRIIEKIIYNLSLTVLININFRGPNLLVNVLLSIKG
jgi:hypothetical protein